MQRSTRAYYTLIGVLVLLLVVCSLAYTTRSKTLSPTTTASARFLNPYVLKDWVPENIYNNVLDHLAFYLAAQNTPSNFLVITSKPDFDDDGTLSLNFQTAATTKERLLTVASTDYGEGIVSTTITIDGSEVHYAPVSKLNSATFSDFSSLTSSGLSGVQAYEIEKSLTQLTQNGQFTVDTDSIKQTTTENNLRTVFLLTIDGKSYKATTISASISDIDLAVSDADGKQVLHTKKNLSD